MYFSDIISSPFFQIVD